MKDDKYHATKEYCILTDDECWGGCDECDRSKRENDMEKKQEIEDICTLDIERKGCMTNRNNSVMKAKNVDEILAFLSDVAKTKMETATDVPHDSINIEKYWPDVWCVINKYHKKEEPRISYVANDWPIIICFDDVAYLGAPTIQDED